MSQDINNLTIEFYYLIQKRLEKSGDSFDTTELAELLEDNFALLQSPTPGMDLRIPLITAVTDYLSGGEVGAIQSTESGKWERGPAFDACLADWLLTLAQDYELDIENDNAVFADTYKKLDLAVESKSCIFTEGDKSDFIRLFLEYTLPINPLDTEEALSSQLQFLILNFFMEHNDKKKATLDEICAGLEPNAQLWFARDKRRTADDFRHLVRNELFHLKNQSFHATSSELCFYEIRTLIGEEPMSTKDTPADETAVVDKTAPSDVNIPYIITWSEELDRARYTTGAHIYYRELVDKIFDDFHIEIDPLTIKSGEPEYLSAPLPWYNILTPSDIESAVLEVCSQKFAYLMPQGIAEESMFFSQEDSVARLNTFELWSIGSGDKKITFSAIRAKDFISGEEFFCIIKEEHGHQVMLPKLNVERADRNDIVKLMNYEPSLSTLNVKDIIKALRDKAQYMPVYYTFDGRGWNSNDWDDCHAFLGARIIDGQGGVYPICPSKELLSSKGDLTQWLDTTKEAIKDNIPAQIILATAFASVLIVPLNVEPLIVNLCGSTSIGKSTFERLATSVWSAPRDPNISLSFNGTELGLIGRMHNNYGVLVVIDDTSKSHDTDLTTFIYQLSDRKSRDKVRRGNELEESHQWGMSVLFSSETPILDACKSDKRGVRRRLLELRLKRGDLTRDAAHAREIDKGIRENYGLAGYAFVEHLFVSRDEIFEEIMESYHEYADKYVKPEYTPLEQALGEKAALLHVTCDLLHEFMELRFDTDGIENYLLELAAQARSPLDDVDSREGTIAMLQKFRTELEDLAISSGQGYIHIPVDDFYKFEVAHGFPKKSLRNVLNEYGLTATNTGRNEHTITYHDGDNVIRKKVISLSEEIFE